MRGVRLGRLEGRVEGPAACHVEARVALAVPVGDRGSMPAQQQRDLLETKGRGEVDRIFTVVGLTAYIALQKGQPSSHVQSGFRDGSPSGGSETVSEKGQGAREFATRRMQKSCRWS